MKRRSLHKKEIDYLSISLAEFCGKFYMWPILLWPFVSFAINQFLCDQIFIISFAEINRGQIPSFCNIIHLIFWDSVTPYSSIYILISSFYCCQQPYSASQPPLEAVVEADFLAKTIFSPTQIISYAILQRDIFFQMPLTKWSKILMRSKINNFFSNERAL